MSVEQKTIKPLRNKKKNNSIGPLHKRQLNQSAAQTPIQSVSRSTPRISFCPRKRLAAAEEVLEMLQLEKQGRNNSGIYW